MTNKNLIDYLSAVRVLKTKAIIKAFEIIDRRDFVPKKFINTDVIYHNAPLPIGYGQTISQPFTVAFMLELLQPKIGDTVLDIGSGSGWTTALLAQIVGGKGNVLGIERIPELVVFGQNNLARYSFANATILNSADFKLEKEKYDKILVSAAALLLPKQYLNALKPNGILVIPIQNSIFKITKNKIGEIKSQEYPGFVFVPLINPLNQPPRLV